MLFRKATAPNANEATIEMVRKTNDVRRSVHREHMPELYEPESAEEESDGNLDEPPSDDDIVAVVSTFIESMFHGDR